MLSADATSEARLECERAGAYAFLTKPVIVDKLLETLAEIAEGVAPRGRLHRGAGGGDRQDARSPSTSSTNCGRWAWARTSSSVFIVECVRDARKCMADLEVAGSKASWDELRDACHALKGVGGQHGRGAACRRCLAKGCAWRPTGCSRDWRGMVNLLRQQLEQASTALRERGDLVASDIESEGN